MINLTNRSVRAANKKQLLEAKKTGLKISVKIIGISNCERCCNGLPEEDLETEIANQRLPYFDCPRMKLDKAYKFCAAVYGMHVLRGEDGLPLKVDKVKTNSIEHTHIRQRKPYNPNTKYGRKKLREQAKQEYENMSTEDKVYQNIKVILILAIICLFMWFILGTEGFLKWL